MFLVGPAAAHLSREEDITWLVILAENTNFYLGNFTQFVAERGLEPRRQEIFLGREIQRQQLGWFADQASAELLDCGTVLGTGIRRASRRTRTPNTPSSSPAPRCSGPTRSAAPHTELCRTALQVTRQDHQTDRLDIGPQWQQNTLDTVDTAAIQPVQRVLSAAGGAGGPAEPGRADLRRLS